MNIPVIWQTSSGKLDMHMVALQTAGEVLARVVELVARGDPLSFSEIQSELPTVRKYMKFWKNQGRG